MNGSEYTHVIYSTARVVLKLPSGPVEISHVTKPGDFATDREITQAEYDSIRECLRQMHDCALMWSSTSFLARRQP
jgi:hypothetical protein